MNIMKLVIKMNNQSKRWSIINNKPKLSQKTKWSKKIYKLKKKLIN